MKARRAGKFYVSHDMINEGQLCEILYKMRFIPYRVEYLAYMDQFEYIGTSPTFEDLNMGWQVPEYKLLVDTEHGEIASVQAVKV